MDSEPLSDPKLSTVHSANVVVTTYGEAHRQAARLAAIPWDLAVLDEAHQLANAGLSDHVQANAIREALEGRRNLLLTATPMQNSVMDLYHLVRFMDETTFAADPEAFRARYVGHAKHRAELAERAQAICYRTLRRHAHTMPATRRVVRTLLVEPSEAETAFSKRMSLYFHRDPLTQRRSNRTLRLKAHLDSAKPDRRDIDVVYEVFLKYGVALTEKLSTLEIEGKRFYVVGESGYMFICLDQNITVEVVEAAAKYTPGTMIFADVCFADNTELTNAALALEKVGIEFRWI